MTWRSFNKLCRREAARVPYHPEAITPEASRKPTRPLYIRFAAFAGTAAVLVAAVAVVLLSGLFKPAPQPVGLDGSSDPGADLLQIYGLLAETTYTKGVEALDASAMTAAQQLQYANQVSLRQNSAPLFTQGSGPDGQNEAIISLQTAQDLLDRVFGPHAVQLSEQAEIGSFLSWEGDTLARLVPQPSTPGSDLQVSVAYSAISPDSGGLTEALCYYVESVNPAGDRVTVTTAAYAQDGPASSPGDLAGYQRLQSELAVRRQTEEPVKRAVYTFGADNGAYYLLSCRNAEAETSSSSAGESDPSELPSLLDTVVWTGQTDPEAMLLFPQAATLLKEYQPPVTAEKKQEAALALLAFLYYAPQEELDMGRVSSGDPVLEALGIPAGAIVWDLPFDSLNRLAALYFEGLEYTREDLAHGFDAEAFDFERNDAQLVWDAQTDRVYFVIMATGSPLDSFVIADETVEGTLIRYTILYPDQPPSGDINDYEAKGFAAVQRYLLETTPFGEGTSVLELSVDTQSGSPRIRSFAFQYDKTADEVAFLVAKAWNLIQVEPSDASDAVAVGTR